MRLDGIRTDGAVLVLLDGGLACVVRGSQSSPAVEEGEARTLGPWTDTDTSLPARRAMEIHLRTTRTVPLQSLRQTLTLAKTSDFPVVPDVDDDVPTTDLAAPDAAEAPVPEEDAAAPEEDPDAPFGGKKAAPFTKDDGGGTTKADQKKKPFGGKKAPPFTKKDAVQLADDPEADGPDVDAMKEEADAMAQEALDQSEAADTAEEHAAAADALEAAAAAQDEVERAKGGTAVPPMGTPEFNIYVEAEVARRVAEAQGGVAPVVPAAVAPVAPIAPVAPVVPAAPMPSMVPGV